MLIRRAGAADNSQLLDFQRRHTMRGSMPLRFDRSPDYFALHRCHADDQRTWIAEGPEGELRGSASLVVRDGYLHGGVEPVAYLGDLRLTPDRRLSRSWMAEVEARLADLSRETGAQHAYCCIIRNNALATQSLLGRRRANPLKLAHWRGYSNVSVYGQRGLSSVPRTSAKVRAVRAAPRYLDALRAFLDSESSRQSFGCVFTEAEFERRLSQWPDFGIDSFLLAVDDRDNLLGCVAPWDAGKIKRIVVEQMPLTQQLLRLGYNALAPLAGRPGIAAPGQALRDIYLTHLQVRQRDPEVFCALMDIAWKQVRNDYSLMQLCLYDQDPLWKAMHRYHAFSLPMDLYTAPCGGHAAEFTEACAASIPGFEIYLV
ncbi:hypothetical protein [Pseudomonas syringae]|uniref:hypothetical protein n=1 Tax=Pseudomonas syringae TaxID=317 RepID=UPI00200B218F|nr:hypothetical protein [Pseudomonas syringae pv. syringae]